MNNVLLRRVAYMLLLACVFALLLSSPCAADEVYGVLAQERVVNLPQDQSKWYISIVGNEQDSHYQRLLGWFGTNARLKSLKSQVHFRQIAEGSETYKKRYAKNVEGLPTVRVQKADGTVVYEAAGASLPFTADGLHGAIVDSAEYVQGPLRPWRHGDQPWLPWRRQCPCPNPEPQPAPEPDLPEPPPLDDGGVPDFSEPESGTVPVGLVVLFSVLSSIVGGGIGLAVQWKETYNQP